MSLVGTSVAKINVEDIAGSLLIGVFISSILFGMFTLHTYQYFHNFPADRKGLKLLVVWVWILEVGHVITSFHYMYFFIAHQLQRAEGKPWSPTPPQTTALALFFSGTITPTIQIFFAYRVRCVGTPTAFTIGSTSWISRHKHNLLPLLCVLGSTSVLIMTSILGSRVSRRPLLVLDLYAVLPRLVTANLATTAAMDVVLAAALCWHLKSMIAGERNVMQRTAVRVKKIMIWALETGISTSLISVSLLIVFLLVPSIYAWQGIYICSTRMHSLSFIVSLNARHSSQQGVYVSRIEMPETIRFQPPTATAGRHGTTTATSLPC